MAGYGVPPRKGVVNVKRKSSSVRRFLALLTAVLTVLAVLAVVVSAETAEQNTGAGQESEAVAEADSGRYAKSNYPKLDANAGFGDRLIYGLKVAGIGMGIVFLVLILLMAILYVFRLFSKPKKQPEKAPVAAPETNSPDEEELIVAIATSAIAASRGESECAFKVISVRKIS